MERSNSNLTFVDFSLCPLFLAEGMNYLKQLQAENIWELRLKFPKDFGRLKATVFTFNHHFPRCEGELRLAIFHRHRRMSTRVDHENLCQEHSKHSHLKMVFWGRASHGCVWNGSMVYPKQSQTWPFQSGKLYMTWKMERGIYLILDKLTSFNGSGRVKSGVCYNWSICLKCIVFGGL